jgi:hypothetical protein
MHCLPSSTRAAQLAAAMALLAVSARHANAQTLGGQVVQLDTKKPLAGASVALVNDSARVVASTAASSEGSFYLDAPSPGGYRVVLFVSGASFVSPALQLDSGKTVERLFSVPNVPETFTRTLFARDVTTPATPLPGSPRPAYPAARLANGERALVSTMFVVNENGQPDMTTFRVLSTSEADFVIPVRDALHRTRFVPAQKDGNAVAQVVQYTFDFGLAGDPERGDVMIRPMAVQAAQPQPAAQPAPQPRDERQVRPRYVIGPDEFATPQVELLMLPEALHQLRPVLYTQEMVRTATSPPDAPIFVNGVLVDGMDYLQHIPARNALEVRYLKKEDAKIQYGMQYRYVILVKLRPDRQ